MITESERIFQIKKDHAEIEIVIENKYLMGEISGAEYEQKSLENGENMESAIRAYLGLPRNWRDYQKHLTGE